ncbi:MAG: DsbA family protein [Dehalococcoidales bacterium]
MGDKLAINWCYFSLEQVNSDQGPKWKVWEQGPDYTSRGMNAFRAAEAARRQSEDGFAAFHYAMIMARHEDKEDISDISILTRIAGSVGLDTERFGKDFSDSNILDRLAKDHTNAVETYGVFGTPTFVFPGDQAAFLKMRPPAPEESLAVFNEVRTVAEGRGNILEIKRPRKPS